MNWCDHIKIEEKKHTRYRCGGKEGLSECVFNFCPECGAKRPARKGLAEKLESECIWTFKDSNHSSPDFNFMARRAMDHACEVINSIEGKKIIGSMLANSIKQALRESI